ncbi:MAG: Spy/CpxP family protein refolding chaperone [Methylocystis sp.]|uniref:Spy/CpxP family protein refolding chaperone n=1 Tax=Methylocystis sp. TaxID=1911079 RepID=UPI003DA3686E
MRNSLKAAALTLPLALAAVGAFGQELGGSRQGGGAAAPEMMCRPYEHVDGQLAYIRAELKLTPAQEAQWNVFATVFRDEKERQALNCRRAQDQNRQMAAASLPDSMRLRAQHLSEQLDSLRRLDAALQPFYESLSKEQKKVADDIMKGAP